jgi:hypothetical protein
MFNTNKERINKISGGFGKRIAYLESEMLKMKTQYTECNVCGCLIKRADRFAVEVEYKEGSVGGSCRSYALTMYPSTFKNYRKEYYCLAHKPLYDRVEDDKYFKDNVEVDSKGQIIKTRK